MKNDTHSRTYSYFFLSVTLISFLFLVLFCSGFTVAADEKDNGNSYGAYLLDKDASSNINWDTAKITSDSNLNKYKKISIKNYYGFGYTLLDAQLLSNTEKCITDCEAILKMESKDSHALISKLTFYLVNSDNSRSVKDTPSYAIYIKPEGSSDKDYVRYEIGTKVANDIYYVKIIGKKGYAEIYDWVITSHGMDFEEWALWGIGHKYCYQETANKTTVTDGNCNLNYTGSYAGGDGAVDASNYLTITYNVPENALNTSIWKIKIANAAAFNVSLHQDCWTNPLYLRIYSDARNLSYSESYAQCWNGTVGGDWVLLPGTNFTSTTGAHGATSATGINLAYDGNWNTYTASTFTDVVNNAWATIAVDNASVYEEAMIWDIDMYADAAMTLSYNMTTFETKRETFTLNVTWDNVSYLYINATFTYNNTKYPVSRVGLTLNNTLFNVDMYVPLVYNLTNNSFYFTLNFTTALRESFYLNISQYNQTVVPIYFTRCNATVDRKYLNVSFLDEITSVRPAEGLIFTTNYSIGETGLNTVQKSYAFDSGSELNTTYNFCFSQTTQNITLTSPRMIYSATTATPSIAERSWSLDFFVLPNNTLTNLTLLSLSAGNPVYITVQDTTGNVLSGVNARITTSSGGTSVVVGSGVTDISGQVIFFLSSVVDYNLFLNRTGCLSRTIGLRPWVYSYTYQLDCGNAGVPLIVPYIGSTEGLTYRSIPASGPIYGSTEFGLRVYSTKYNINAIQIQLMETNFTIRANMTKVVDNITCYPQDCMLNFTFDDVNMGKIKGRYLVNLTLNGTTTSWYILEQDAYWTRYIAPTANQSNMKNAWRDFRNIFNDWNEYTGTAEEANRAEFSRIIFIFLIMAMLIAAFNKFTGYDSANPGAFLAILSSIFWLGSLAGGRNCAEPGFFYLDGLFGSDHTVVNGVITCTHGLSATYILNNYIIAISVFLIFLTYILNVQRRNS